LYKQREFLITARLAVKPLIFCGQRFTSSQTQDLRLSFIAEIKRFVTLLVPAGCITMLLFMILPHPTNAVIDAKRGHKL